MLGHQGRGAGSVQAGEEVILWSLAPAASAVFMFFWLLVRPPRPKLRATTQQEREWVAARSRTWRVVGLTILVFVAPLVVAALHLFASPSWMPRELS